MRIVGRLASFLVNSFGGKLSVLERDEKTRVHLIWVSSNTFFIKLKFIVVQRGRKV